MTCRNQSSRTSKRCCDGCRFYVRDAQQLAVGDGAYPEVSACAMCRLQLTAQPLRRAGLKRGEMIWTDTKSLSMLVLTVAGGVAGVVECLIERYLVTPIMSRWKPRGWL